MNTPKLGSHFENKLDLKDAQKYVVQFNLKFSNMLQIYGYYNQKLLNPRQKIN